MLSIDVILLFHDTPTNNWYDTLNRLYCAKDIRENLKEIHNTYEMHFYSRNIAGFGISIFY